MRGELYGLDRLERDLYGETSWGYTVDFPTPPTFFTLYGWKKTRTVNFISAQTTIRIKE